jgi:hypothetical protein
MKHDSPLAKVLLCYLAELQATIHVIFTSAESGFDLITSVREVVKIKTILYNHVDPV